MHKSQPTNKNVLGRLQQIYGRLSLQPDSFGSRPALPSEIQRTIHSTRWGAPSARQRATGVQPLLMRPAKGIQGNL